jgi:heptosyltransferase II
MVMATPFLHALRRSLDDELWGIGKSIAVNVYHGLSCFDRFITLDSRGVVPFLDLVTQLRALDFRRAIALPHSFRSALLFFAAGIPERIGYSRNHRGQLLTQRVPEGPGPEPTVEHYLKIIDTLGLPRLIDAPLIFVTEDEEQKFDKRHTEFRRSYIAFIPGAQYGPSKCWPEEYFSELADLVAEHFGLKTYILPGRGEEAIAQRIVEGAKRKDSVEVKLLDIVDLKVCLSRATAVVSNDTGPRHIAAALSTPTVVFMGPMDERYTLYPSPHVSQLTAEVPCRPCNKRKCEGDHACMEGIKPLEVLSRLKDLLGSEVA